MAVKPNLFSHGMVTPSGALSRPLIDFLSELQASGDSSTLSAALSALGLRVSALEADDGVQIQVSGNLTISGDAESGYLITGASDVLASQIFGS